MKSLYHTLAVVRTPRYSKSMIQTNVRKDSQRERIVRATGRLFRDQGYHGTSMADIGKAVGLEKGSLYTHIAAKQDVLRELVDRGASAFAAALDPILSAPDPAPVRLRRALRAHLRVVAEHPDLAAVFLHEWRRLDGDDLARVGRLRDDYEAGWRAIIAAGVRDGELRAGTDPRVAARLFLSAGNWAHQGLDPAGPLTADQVADAYCDLMLVGLCPPPPSPDDGGR